MNSVIAKMDPTEAISHEAAAQTSRPPCMLMLLPTEIVASICTFLPNGDIKNVRLACRFLAATAALRMDRVFLSMFPKDVELFLAVANHEVLRRRIVEIIWDETVLPSHGKVLDNDNVVLFMSDPQDPEPRGDEQEQWPEVPAWFSVVTENNLNILAGVTNWNRRIDWRQRWQIRERWRKRTRSHAECWQHYTSLLDDMRKCYLSGSPKRALDYGLGRFPALRRITLAGGVHGKLFDPLYETPTIRSFPSWFNYPIPTGWLPGTTGLWGSPLDWEETLEQDYVGFRYVVQALADNKDSGTVKELRVDANHLDTGLNVNLFSQPTSSSAGKEIDSTSTYENLVRVLKRPSFRHLHLDLCVDGQSEPGRSWCGFHSGLLRSALAGAANDQSLEHLSIGTNVCLGDEFEGHAAEMDLSAIIPTKAGFPRLKHIGLSGFWVKQIALLAFLEFLPESLVSLELRYLRFEEGGYGGFLDQLRYNTNWRHRDPRPRVRIGLVPRGPDDNKDTWLEAEVDAFLYGGGENPLLNYEYTRHYRRSNLLGTRRRNDP